MKAIRKSDGKVIEVNPFGTDEYECEADLGIYSKKDLDFNLPTERDTDLTISLAKLREVLNKYSKEKNLMIDDFDTEEIINRIKQELK